MKKNFKFIILADDLTGCGDISYFSINLGLKTEIISYQYFLNLKNLDTNDDVETGQWPVSCDSRSSVLIINVDTRLLDPQEAYKRTKKVCEHIKKLQFQNIFKKMDSTLRGNFAIENDALFDVFNIDHLPLLAAFPEYGRTTKDGIHYVSGIEISKTEYAFDPKNPVTESHIPTILRTSSAYAEKTDVYDSFDIESLKLSSKEIINKWQKDKVNYKIATGTSRFFGEILEQILKIPTTNNFKTIKFCNLIIMSGSKNSVTKSQINYLCEKIDFTAEKVEAEYELHKNINNSVTIIKAPEKHIENYKLKLLASKLKDIIKNNNQDTLIVLCGGATSQEAFAFLDINRVQVISPVDTGIVLIKEANRNISFILKPGAYGLEDFLYRIIETGH